MVKYKLLVALILIVTNASFGQERKVVRDFGIWVGAAVQKKVHKNVRLELDQQLRTHVNSTRLDDYLADFGAEYAISKHFDVGANIRYIYNVRRFEGARHDLRYNVDFGFKIDIVKKLRVYYRLRYHQKFETFYQPSKEFNTTIRNRIKLRYKLPKRNQIYLSGEVFRFFPRFGDAYFNTIRLCLGDKVDITSGSIDVAFCYEVEPESSWPASFYFLRIGYVWKP